MRTQLLASSFALLAVSGAGAAEPDNSKSLFQRNTEATRAAADRGDLGNTPAAEGYIPKRPSNTVQDRQLKDEERRVQQEEQGRNPDSSSPRVKSAK